MPESASPCKNCRECYRWDDISHCETCGATYCNSCEEESFLDERDEDEGDYHECIYCTKQREKRRYTSKELLRTALSQLGMKKEDLIKIHNIDEESHYGPS